MPRKKIDGVSQGDTGKYCLLTHLILAPNARDFIEPVAFAELRAQIKSHNGVHTALRCSVQPGDKGLIVWDGQRRFLAAQELGMEKVPVTIMRGNDLDMILSAGTGDGEQHDLVAQIRWVQMATNAGAGQKLIAEKRGVSTTWVSQRAKMASLSEVAREALRAGIITMTKALKLAAKAESEQNETISKIVEAKENGTKKPGSEPPKRPGVKPCRKLADRFEDASGASQIQIEAFQDGIKYASGDMSLEEVYEKYELED